MACQLIGTKQSNKLMWSYLIRGLDTLIEELGQFFWLTIIHVFSFSLIFNMQVKKFTNVLDIDASVE